MALAHTELPALMRAAMLANAAVAAAVVDRVFYQSMDRNERPYVWFTRSGYLNEDDLEGGSGIAEETFTIEIISEQSIDTLIDGIKEALQGMIGSNDIQYVDIENVDDDYLFRSSDEIAEFETALRVIVYL